MNIEKFLKKQILNGTFKDANGKTHTPIIYPKVTYPAQ